MKKRFACPQQAQTARLKTLGVIGDRVVQKVGEVSFLIGAANSSIFSGVTIDELNRISFRFEQVGPPKFTTRVLKNKVINCGYIQFVTRSIGFPASIPQQLRAIISSFLFSGNEPKVISIPLQGALDVCGVREDDDIEEFFDVEGAAACIVLETLSGFDSGSAAVLLLIKAAVNTRIIVSRYKLVNADVSDIDDVTDFGCS